MKGILVSGPWEFMESPPDIKVTRAAILSKIRGCRIIGPPNTRLLTLPRSSVMLMVLTNYKLVKLKGGDGSWIGKILVGRLFLRDYH
jgi:hypothetical protein